MDIEILGTDTDTSHIELCLCGKGLLSVPSPSWGKNSPKDNSISCRNPSCNRLYTLLQVVSIMALLVRLWPQFGGEVKVLKISILFTSHTWSDTSRPTSDFELEVN